MTNVVIQSLAPLTDVITNDVFQPNGMAQCIIRAEQIVKCNAAAVKLNSNCLRATDKAISVYDISPYRQPDGMPSRQKLALELATCRQFGNHSFNWVYQTQAGRLKWLAVSLSTIEHNGLELFHANLRPLDAELEGVNKLAIQDSVQDSSDFANYVLLNEYKRAIDQSSIVSKADRSGKITYVNDKFVQVSGFSREELVGKPHSIINHPDTPKSLFKELWQTINSGKVWKGIIKNKKKNGEAYYVDSSISPIINAQGEITEFIAIRNDITEMYQQEKLIVYQNTDEATGLPNRTKLELDLAQSKPNYLAVIKFKELEQFSHIFSSAIYQQILADITELIQEHFSLLKTRIQLYKISTLKYAILSEQALERAGFQYQLESLLNLIMQMDMKVEGFDIPLTVQSGWCDGEHVGVNNALLALNETAKLGKLATRFEPNTNTFKMDIESAVDWTVKLKNAIAENRICLFGQKILDCSGKLYSTEVLMRYCEGQGEQFVSPNVFLKYAKKSKIYSQLSKFVITQSCLYFKARKQRFSVNFTLADLQDNDIRAQLIYLLEASDLGSYLTLELLETEAFNNDDKQVTDFLFQLKSLGVQIAIDDFGSGYSNFNYFTLLPVDIVKIDGSLICDIDSNEKHFLLVKSIAEFCQQMNIRVVAEFVATGAVFEKLKALKIDYFQGFHLHLPEPLN